MQNIQPTLYDKVLLPNGEKIEILQVFKEGEYMVMPLSGGTPRRMNITEGEITHSLFGEAKKMSCLERFRNLIQAAEERWDEHSRNTSKRKGGGRKKSEPTINLNIDF